MKKLSLTDLFPETGTFTLAATGAADHRLRPVSLADRAWIERHLGGSEALQDMFEKVDFVRISRLVFYLLEDKSPFPQGEEDDVDGDGEILGKRKVKGPEQILKCITSPNEQISLMKALLKTIGVSEAILGDVEKQIDGASAAEKKRAASRAVLRKSPTGKKLKT